MPAARFVHLHNHSEYSLLDGAIRIRDLVATVKSMGMKAVALTDHGNLFGAIPFYRIAVECGVKPILGMETYVARGSITEKNKGRGASGNDHLTLLVKNEEGYRNLILLSSISYTEGFYYKPRIDMELLSRHGKGLVALSGCLQGGKTERRGINCNKDARDLFRTFIPIHSLSSSWDLTKAARRSANSLNFA